ncbi:diguanylate cyclase [Methyloprofundus sp.]|uniref:diguanylate cyclase n=1 Tax=Methyloprofundus sp. TaxID=2020875 RepID=UPI003D0ADBD7
MTNIANQYLAIHQTANSLLKRKVNDLQVFPALAIKLLCLTSPCQGHNKALCKLIETEPTLTSQVLDAVNSLAFSEFKVQSIKHAINTIGGSKVKQFALSQLLFNKLIYKKANFEFDQLFFWQHCLYVATLAREIAVSLDHNDPDLLFSAGLLHDIGKIILETHAKHSYSDFIRHSKNDKTSFYQQERNFFGLTHAEIGYIFCQQSHIPREITASVYYHHHMPDDSCQLSDCKKEIAIISLADYIASSQGIGSTFHNTPNLHSDVLQQIDCATIDMHKLLTSVDQEMQNTCAIFDLTFPDPDKLRTSLVKSSILSSQNREYKNHAFTGNSLTIPHKSLNPDEIIPATLDSIQQDFHFDRLIMLNINPKQRNLEVSYCWPQSLKESSLQHFNIQIDLLPDTLLNNLRERKAAIINNNHQENKVLLEPFQVFEFLLLPVVSNNRLTALLYADNDKNHLPIDDSCIAYITPIIHELGIALANAQNFIQEKNRAELDSLTGLSNSRMLTEFLNHSFQLSQQQLSQIAVGFIDIDFFKKCNDTCGHQVGDEALIMVAQIMRSLNRPGDFIGRFGGDEFVFALQDTDKQGVYSYAERIRLEVEQQGKILSRQFLGHEITISIGVSLYHQDFNNYEKFLSAADSAMYQAKHKGRNCVVVI